MVNHKLFWSIIVSLVVLDQLTKWLVVTYQPALKILPFFALVTVHNTGAGFGLFQGWNIAFILLSVIVLGFLGWYYPKLKEGKVLVSVALVFAGATGNLIDRLFRGAVVDFLDFFVAGYHWPAFNVADSAIVIGVVLLLIVTWKK